MIKDKRERILLAAIEVVSQKGYHQASIEEIAKTANIGKGTVYVYFSSKEELFQELVKYSIQKFFEMLEQELNGIRDPKEKLKVVMIVYARFAIKHTNFAKIVLNDIGVIGEPLKRGMMTARRKMVDLLGSIIDLGIKQGMFREVDRQTAALMFIGSMGANIAPRIFCDETDLEEKNYDKLIEKILEIFFGGIIKKQVQQNH